MKCPRNPEKLLEVTKFGIYQRVLKVPSIEGNMKDWTGY